MNKPFSTINIWLIIMTVLAIAISLYPIGFAFIPGLDSLFKSKPTSLLTSELYKPIFYTHIGFGGIALFAGCSQFFSKFRMRNFRLHRNLGKIYVLSVIISGLAGLYAALYATGGLVAIIGFLLLAIFWLYTTVIAFMKIRNRNIVSHQHWMIRSYALCFAAVTLRIYLGLSAAFGIPFLIIYPIIAWLAWVPNLIFAEYRIKIISSQL